MSRDCSCCPPYKLRVGDYIGYVYRCYDLVGDLAYIGSAADVFNRLQVHMNQGAIGPYINGVYYTSYADIETARAAEVEAIRRERPPLNRQHNPDYAGLSREDADVLFEEALAELAPADGPPAYISDARLDGLEDRPWPTPEGRIEEYRQFYLKEYGRYPEDAERAA
jgi:hypothetical protein